MKKTTKNALSSSKPTKQRSDSPVGEMLRRWREEQGFTQDQAADLLGIGRSTLSQWEAGRRSPVLDADSFPGLLRVLQESGLISNPVQMPDGSTLSELESRVIQAIRDEFKAAKPESEQLTSN